jgi:hypothetical protein
MEVCIASGSGSSKEDDKAMPYPADTVVRDRVGVGTGETGQCRVGEVATRSRLAPECSGAIHDESVACNRCARLEWLGPHRHCLHGWLARRPESIGLFRPT